MAIDGVCQRYNMAPHELIALPLYEGSLDVVIASRAAAQEQEST